MIEAFVLTEDTPGAVTRDLFLTFRGGDAGTIHYPQRLADELQAQLLAAAETLIDQGVAADFMEQSPTVTSFSRFLDYVTSFVDQLKNLKGRTVIYLHPRDVTDQTAFVSLVEDSLKAGLPGNLMLMLHSTEEGMVGQRFAGRRDWGVKTLRPELHMDALANELASEGDPNDPAVQFRTLFLELSQLGGQGAFEPMKEKGEKALALTQQQEGWEHMSAVVLAAQGSHLLSRKANRKEAMTFFDRAVAAAHLAIQVGNPAGRATLIQTHNFKAAGLVSMKSYEAAADSYLASAAVAAEEEDDRFHRMEALRMAGWCKAQAGDNEAAWQLNLDALEAAEGLSPEILRGSPLPYAGRELMQLVERLNRHAGAKDIRLQLERLIGNDWDELLHKAENPVPA